VAKNGKAHSISVNNQAKFDAYNNVEALALDTVSTDKRMYLTFDCGYEYKNLTASILDTLKAKNVKAACFCTLDYLEDNPQLVHRMINEGHIVGNHRTTHPDFTTISRTKMAEELYISHKYLIDNFDYEAKYFRFPTGAFSESALELVTSVGYKSVFWSLAHKDWETANQPSHTYALEKIKGGFYNRPKLSFKLPLFSALA
jgi:peptidoglycan-N-acetylmuramic acid deacetylase